MPGLDTFVKRERRTTMYCMPITCKAPEHILSHLILKTTLRNNYILDIIVKVVRIQIL